jgi:hypothetical protein
VNRALGADRPLAVVTTQGGGTVGVDVAGESFSHQFSVFSFQLDELHPQISQMTQIG